MAKKTSTKGLMKSPKAGSSSLGIKQKLGSGRAPAGVDVSSKMEKAATVPYKGHDQGSGVKHGSQGLLAGRGGKKNLGVPSA